MQRLCLFTITPLLIAAGCSAPPAPRPLAADHPASADAATSPMPQPSEALAHPDPLTTRGGHDAH